MSLRNTMILLTLISVICDTMLLPFYPEFFAVTFSVSDDAHIGYYIACCCFTVMVSFPLWAKVASHIDELHLWVYTQIVAGGLGIYCYFSDSLVSFWIISQIMLIFKASYLLIYPYVMRLEEHHAHIKIVSIFSVLMHFGAIGGALLGGLILDSYEPRTLYLIMAGGDFLQTATCILLIRKIKPTFLKASKYLSAPFVHDSSPKTKDMKSKAPPISRESQNIENYSGLVSMPKSFFLLKLSLFSLCLYFSAFMIRPFFISYWESIYEKSESLFSAFVYSIPAWVALIALKFNSRSDSESDIKSAVFFALFFVILGVVLQSSENITLIILGRCIFGWGIFQSMVKTELMLFRMSEPEHYARDFSKLHLSQNVGVIIASLSVGTLTSEFGLTIPFHLSIAAFILTLFVFVFFFKERQKRKLLRYQPKKI